MVKATPTKSRTPFYGLLALIVVAGAVGIFYSMNAAPKPIVLDEKAIATLPVAEGYLRGDPKAPVTIIEFGDFECPSCGNFATVSEPDIRARILSTGAANFRFYDYPLPMHQNTLSAHLAASCANAQGKFWEMHDELFAAQDQWNTQSTSNPRKVIDGLAKKIGLDAAVYNKCMSDQNMSSILANRKAGEARGVSGTPTIFIGNTQINSASSVDKLKAIVDSLAKLAPPAPAAAPAADTTKKKP